MVWRCVPVDAENAETAFREMPRRGAPHGAEADDRDVETLHASDGITLNGKGADTCLIHGSEARCTMQNASGLAAR